MLCRRKRLILDRNGRVPLKPMKKTQVTLFGLFVILALFLPLMVPLAQASCNYYGGGMQVWTDKSRYSWTSGDRYVWIFGSGFSPNCAYRFVISMNPSNMWFGAYVKAGETQSYARFDGTVLAYIPIQIWWTGTMRLQAAPPDGSRVLAEYHFFMKI